ncbi:MAG TPA: hypothetical protein VE988_14490, partial [Gemmataceae bacterium]|nr:hypothetical protein [Gemmataceae bacterium]
MRVFRTSYRDQRGQTKQAAKWYIEFRDHLEFIRRLPAHESKAASEELGRNIDKLVAFHKASGGQTDPALTRFLAGLESRTIEKLVAIGLLDPSRVATAKSLADHLDDFAASLAAKGNSARHVALVTSRARKLLVDKCGFRFFGDISASKAMDALHAMRTEGDAGRTGTGDKAG